MQRINIKILIAFLLIGLINISYFPFSTWSTSAAETKVTIFHTNDMHGNIYSIYDEDVLMRIGLDNIKTAKDSTPNALLIDAGDATQGTPMGKLSKGLDIVKIMNQVGYDCMTLGNHEFDYGVNGVLEIAQKATCPVISANTMLDGQPMLKDINGSNGCNWVKEINGKKIGFFGITTEETMRTTIPDNLIGVSFNDEIETAKQQVAELKKQSVDCIVGITHLGVDASSKTRSIDIAENVSGIDVIIDGHSHSVYTQKVGNTVIQQTGNVNSNLGKIELTFKNRASVDVNASLLTPQEVGKMYPPDAQVSNLYNSLYDNIAPTLERVVGRTASSLYGGSYNGKNISRMAETNLGSLICDAMLNESKEIIKSKAYETYPLVAMENGGAVRSKINQGYITMENILEVLPLDNRLSLQIITPEILFQTMERGVSKMTNPKSAGDPLDGFFGGYPQLGGMRIEYDINNTAYDTNNPLDYTGNRVTKIVLLNEDGSDLQEIYRTDKTTPIIFACNDYTVTEYPMVNDLEIVQKGDFLSNVLAKYITKKCTESDNGFLEYPLIQNRSKLLKQDGLFIPFDSQIEVLNEGSTLISQNVNVKLDNQDWMNMTTDSQGKLNLSNLSSGEHNVKVEYNGYSDNAYINELVGLKNGKVALTDSSSVDVKSVINLIQQIPENPSSQDKSFVDFISLCYNDLNQTNKNNVTNDSVLQKAQQTFTNNLNTNSIPVVIISIATLATLIVILLALKDNKRSRRTKTYRFK